MVRFIITISEIVEDNKTEELNQNKGRQTNQLEY
jgi:hypothetical protein